PARSPSSLPLYFSYYAALSHPHSFPTRRSSDLMLRPGFDYVLNPSVSGSTLPLVTFPNGYTIYLNRFFPPSIHHVRTIFALTVRSEEHTSELQSRFDIVCRLLLEKKKIDEYAAI